MVLTLGRTRSVKIDIINGNVSIIKVVKNTFNYKLKKKGKESFLKMQKDVYTTFKKSLIIH